MKKIALFSAVMLITFTAFAQGSNTWTEKDRQYLLENLIRSKEELNKETEGLEEKQWRFKESEDRWSINEVVEHITLWETLLMHEITRALRAGHRPEFYKTAKPDSIRLSFITEEKPHHSLEYTQPFSYTIPMGLNELKNNRTWFMKLRDESIGFVKTTTLDLRGFAQTPERPNLHQVYITVFGHTDRHLRQIRKIKLHPNYPK
jgi:hypothetical protein